MVLGAGDADDEGVALAATAAERGSPGSPAAAAQFQGEGQDEPGTAHADRMTQRRRRRSLSP